MPVAFYNNTAATVSSGGTTAPLAGTAESWTVATAGLAGFPVSFAGPFHVADPALTGEKILVTAISGAGPYTWTVTRGDEGTTPVAHAPGFTIQQVVTAGEYAALTPPVSWAPADQGFLAWTLSPALCGGGSLVLTAGTVYLSKVLIRYPFTWSTMWYAVTATGVGTSAGSFAGLYSSAGTLLTGSADIGGNLTAVGAKSTALTAPQALTPSMGFVWAAVVVNLATTQPGLLRCATNQAGPLNANLSAAQFLGAHNGTGQTSLPASVTPSSNSADSLLWFAAA